MILSPDELVELTGKRTRPAQRRELDRLGIPYKPRSDGTLVVSRAAANAALAGEEADRPEAEEPDFSVFG